jgi:hypothetical protein
VYKLISQMADTVGDGSGTIFATGNYSGNPTEFKFTAQPAQHVFIERMIVGLEAADFARSDYYGDAAALSVGISLYVTDDNGDIQYYLTDVDAPIKTNAQWAHYCYDFQRFNTDLPTGTEAAAVRWTFAKTGQPVELLPGWSLCILLQDNMAATLDDQHFLLQGYYEQPRIGDEDGHA